MTTGLQSRILAVKLKKINKQASLGMTATDCKRLEVTSINYEFPDDA